MNGGFPLPAVLPSVIPTPVTHVSPMSSFTGAMPVFGNGHIVPVVHRLPGNVPYIPTATFTRNTPAYTLIVIVNNKFLFFKSPNSNIFGNHMAQVVQFPISPADARTIYHQMRNKDTPPVPSLEIAADFVPFHRVYNNVMFYVNCRVDASQEYALSQIPDTLWVDPTQLLGSQQVSQDSKYYAIYVWNTFIASATVPKIQLTNTSWAYTTPTHIVSSPLAQPLRVVSPIRSLKPLRVASPVRVMSPLMSPVSPMMSPVVPAFLSPMFRSKKSKKSKR